MQVIASRGRYRSVYPPHHICRVQQSSCKIGSFIMCKNAKTDIYFQQLKKLKAQNYSIWKKKKATHELLLLNWICKVIGLIFFPTQILLKFKLLVQSNLKYLPNFKHPLWQGMHNLAQKCVCMHVFWFLKTRNRKRTVYFSIIMLGKKYIIVCHF